MVNLDDIFYISSEELKRNFEKYRVLARATVPICVWEEGMAHPDVMLVSGYEWRKIHRKREVIKVADMDPEWFETLVNSEMSEEHAYLDRFYAEPLDVRPEDFSFVQRDLCRRTRRRVETPEPEYDCSTWVQYEEFRNANGKGYCAEYVEYVKLKIENLAE